MRLRTSSELAAEALSFSLCSSNPMAPHSPRARLAIAAALALGSIGAVVPIASSPAPKATEGSAVPTVPNVTRGSFEQGRSTSTESATPTAVRSLLTQMAILKKNAHRDRVRHGHRRGTWVPRKSGGRLAYFHAQ